MRNLVSVGLLVTCLSALGLIGLCAPVQSLIGAKNNFVGNQSGSGMPYDAEVEWIATDGCKFQTSGCYGERDFIPVRIGYVGYMYDRANPESGPSGNGLYGNITSGVLNAGPDVRRQ